MTMIKKHQCPSCGGNLTVDNDKQMYRDFVRKDRLRMNDKCG